MDACESMTAPTPDRRHRRLYPRRRSRRYPRPASTRLAVPAVALLLAAACTSTGDTNDGGAGPGTTTPRPPTSTSPDGHTHPDGTAGRSTEETPTETGLPGLPTPDPSEPSPESPITISFAGDMHFEGALRSRLDDPGTALHPIASNLSAADLTVVNLETSVGTGGTPEPKRYTFQAPPSAFNALASAGVDVVTMANNHAMDYGLDGFAETLDAARLAADADPPLSVVGIGEDIGSALEPAVHEIRGTTVAVLGASFPDDPTADPTAQWAADDGQPGIAVALDPSRLLDAVEAARSAADVVIVYAHWGVQGDECPSSSQRALAADLAEAGADIVVGSHTHRLQGAGFLGDTYVAYGLGNFAWYTQSSAATSTTGVLTLTVDDGRVTAEEWAPAVIRSSGLPEFTGGADAQGMIEDFADLRECTDLAPLTASGD